MKILLALVANYLQVKTRIASLLAVCATALLAGSCSNQDTLSLTFTEQQAAQNFSLEKIYFFNDTLGLAMGGDDYQYGIAQHTEDGGLTWSLDTVSLKIVHDFDVVQDAIFGTGIDSYISQKQGLASWIERRPPIWKSTNGIIKTNTGFILAGGIAIKEGSLTILSDDLQIVDTLSFPGEINAIARSRQSHFHLAGYGQLYRSDDAGITWQVNAQEGDNYRNIFFINEQVGWVVGDAGSILKTENGGLDWEILNKPRVHNKAQFSAVHFHSELDGIAVGRNGLVWITDDGGSNWSVVEDVPAYNYTSVFMQMDIAWLCTDNGHIIRLFL